MDTFTQAYIECALWSSTAYGSPEENKADPKHEGHFDSSFQSCGYDRLTKDCERAIIRDCEAFQRDNAELLAQWYSECGESPERAGHDFWLTRNHHGVGFWDRWSGPGIERDIANKLTAAAHIYGEFDLYYSRGKVACA